MKTPDGMMVGVVCSNGLGHFRRTTEIFRRVLEAAPLVRTAIVCERWQVERMATTATVRWLSDQGRTEWIHDIMAPGVGWSADANAYEDGRLISWLDRLRRVPELNEADLVVSDNLVGTLEICPDAVLQGSFLWSTLFEAARPATPCTSAFVTWERTLLERYRPPMLCVRGFAMADVLERTQAVELPWMCPDTDTAAAPARREGTRLRVLAIGGATGAGDEALARALRAIAAMGNVDLAGPVARAEGFASIPFNYGDAEFRSFDAVVCRPGMGTIHECIAHGLPMICCSEPGNPEMTNNANIVESEGLGANVGQADDPRGIQHALIRVAKGAEATRIRQRMVHGRKDGLDQAARWLLTALYRNT